MVFKRLLFVAVTLCLMAMPSAFAQDIIWSKTYGFPESSELGLCGNLTSDGGYVISGVSYHFSGLSGEFWLVQTGANGDTLWTRNYGGDRWQEAHYVIQTDDGGFALCGGTNVAVGDDDLYVVKTDSLGDTLWTQSFGVLGEQDDGQAIIQTSDGGYLAVGSGWNGILSDLLMVRMDSSGNILWTKLYGASNAADYAYGVVETADSGFAITGTYNSGAASDLWLLRTYPNGDTIWTRKFDFNNYMDRGDQIVMTSDGGFAIGGRTFLPSDEYRLLVLRTDSLGNEIWHREFAGLDRAFAESIDKTGDGGFVIAGGTRVGYGSLDYYVVRTSSTGDSLWAAVYDYDGLTGDSEDCYEVKVDAEGNIIAFGYADIDPSGYDAQYWMLKIRDNALVSNGYIHGQVLEDDSTPIEDVNVSVYDSDDNLVGTDTTDLDGEFDFTLLPGTYYAMFSKTGYIDTTLTDLNVVSDETTYVSLIMYPSGFIAGVVKEQDDVTPIAEVEVSVYDSGDDLVGTDTTDIDGEFDFILDPGTYYAMFSKTGYVDTTLTGLDVVSGETTYVSLIMYPSGCDYTPGDINGDSSVMGNDVTYGVRYFKGIGPQPPDSCWNDSTSSWLYSAGDVNGSCSFTGSDITFLVAYFKGYNPEILWCPQTPPAETPIILIKDEEKTPAIIPKE